MKCTKCDKEATQDVENTPLGKLLCDEHAAEWWAKDMNSIYECDRVERLERALLVLEGLTFLQEHDETPFVSEVYQIAHAALGFCGAKDHHDKTWLGAIPKWEEILKEKKVINVEKVLNERSKQEGGGEHKKDSQTVA